MFFLVELKLIVYMMLMDDKYEFHLKLKNHKIKNFWFKIFYQLNYKYVQDDQKQMMKDVVGLIVVDMFAYID